jgi:glycerol dehydrogenase
MDHRNGPVRFLTAGMGDALATWFEADSCRRTQSENACGGLGTLVGHSIARLCYETLLEYGPSAKTPAKTRSLRLLLRVLWKQTFC